MHVCSQCSLSYDKGLPDRMKARVIKDLKILPHCTGVTTRAMLREFSKITRSVILQLHSYSYDYLYILELIN